MFWRLSQLVRLLSSFSPNISATVKGWTLQYDQHGHLSTHKDFFHDLCARCKDSQYRMDDRKQYIIWLILHLPLYSYYILVFFSSLYLYIYIIMICNITYSMYRYMIVYSYFISTLYGDSSSLMWLSTTWCDFSVSPPCHGDDVTFPAWCDLSTVLVDRYVI